MGRSSLTIAWPDFVLDGDVPSEEIEASAKRLRGLGYGVVIPFPSVEGDATEITSEPDDGAATTIEEIAALDVAVEAEQVHEGSTLFAVGIQSPVFQQRTSAETKRDAAEADVIDLAEQRLLRDADPKLVARLTLALYEADRPTLLRIAGILLGGYT